jgi:lysophospholipase L1-like esterase
MGKARVLILGHSFIRRLQDLIIHSRDHQYTKKFGITTPDFISKWHGVGGRTIANVLKYDLSVIKEFGPDIVILQLGTNDLVDSSPLTVGSPLENLATLLHDEYKVDLICVCQTLRRSSSNVSFNKNVGLLTKIPKNGTRTCPIRIRLVSQGVLANKEFIFVS